MAGIKSRTLAACCGDSGKGEPLNRENLADANGQWFPPGGYRALFRRNFEIQDPPVCLLPRPSPASGLKLSFLSDLSLLRSEGQIGDRSNVGSESIPVYLLPRLRVSRRLLLLGLMAEQDRQSV
jgi:hypothetical protein